MILPLCNSCKMITYTGAEWLGIRDPGIFSDGGPSIDVIYLTAEKPSSIFPVGLLNFVDKSPILESYALFRSLLLLLLF